MKGNNLLIKGEKEARKIMLRFLGELSSLSFRAKNDKNWTFEEIGSENKEVLELDKNAQVSGKKGLCDFIHPEEQDYVSNEINSAIRKGNKFQVITRLDPDIQKDKWLWIKGKGIFDENRNLRAFEGFLTDITRRKRTVDELRTRENFYENTLHTMPIELVVLNSEQRYIFCNKTAIQDEETRKWLIGKNDFEYCKFRKKDLKIAKKRQKYFQSATHEGREIEWEEVFHDKTGKMVYALRRLSPIFDEDGDLQMVIGYGFDITDRRVMEEKVKENERLLKSINANIQEGIYRYSVEKGFLYINDAFIRLFNYDLREELLNDADAFFAYDSGARKELINIQGKSGSFNNKEILFKRTDGSKFWGLVSCSKKPDEDHNVLFDGVIVDIKELKEAERMLKEKNEELIKANNELDRFIYSASHDLRAPLTSILGIVKVAEMEFKDSYQKQYLDMIQKSVHKLDYFVNDLIDYYRNSRSHTHRDKINFEKLINESFDNFKYLKGADKLKINVDNKQTDHFYSDEYRIKIIFNNLISNAIKYQNPEAREPFVNISINGDEEQTKIIVQDNGKGIDQKKLGKIFDMFYRAAQDSDSSGLGLYIVKEAVSKLDGKIYVDSATGRGTKFTLSIPNLLKYGKNEGENIFAN